jgi:hypothetical protein
MKAAVVTAAGKTPVYGNFDRPIAKAGEELISVRASALSHHSKARASGSHYSSDGIFPSVPCALSSPSIPPPKIPTSRAGERARNGELGLLSFQFTVTFTGVHGLLSTPLELTEVTS